jgi:hypothetical protein
MNVGSIRTLLPLLYWHLVRQVIAQLLHYDSPSLPLPLPLPLSISPSLSHTFSVIESSSLTGWVGRRVRERATRLTLTCPAPSPSASCSL